MKNKVFVVCSFFSDIFLWLILIICGFTIWCSENSASGIGGDMENGSNLTNITFEVLQSYKNFSKDGSALKINKNQMNNTDKINLDRNDSHETESNSTFHKNNTNITNSMSTVTAFQNSSYISFNETIRLSFNLSNQTSNSETIAYKNVTVELSQNPATYNITEDNKSRINQTVFEKKLTTSIILTSVSDTSPMDIDIERSENDNQQVDQSGHFGIDDETNKEVDINENDIPESEIGQKDSEITDNQQSIGKTEIKKNPNDDAPKFSEKISVLPTDDFDEESTTNFLTYFLIASTICVLFYVAYHKRTKIIGLLIEGRPTRRYHRL